MGDGRISTIPYFIRTGKVCEASLEMAMPQLCLYAGAIFGKTWAGKGERFEGPMPT